MRMAKQPGLLATVAAAAIAAGVLLAQPAAAQQKTLKFVPEADLRSLDPIWTTAYITRNYGYMVYDTLFAVNDKFEPKPQMVDKWALSGDKLTYTFTLRDGLKWHDGQPVRSAGAPKSVIDKVCGSRPAAMAAWRNRAAADAGSNPPRARGNQPSQNSTTRASV